MRLAPSVIPLDLLIGFEPGLRAQLAEARGLQTDADLIPLARDDGGPPLETFRPHGEIDLVTRDNARGGPVRVDASGFCNDGDEPATAADVDVVALGDSFTWCTAVAPRDAWPAVMGRMGGFSVYNLGRPAIGLHEYLQIYDAFGAEKRPRLVILNVYEGNDLRDAVRFHRHLAGQSHDGRPHLEPLSGFLGRHSALANLAWTGWGKTGAKWLARRKLKKTKPDFGYRIRVGGVEIPFNVENADRDEARHAAALLAGEISLSAFDDALRGFAARARAQGFAPLVIYSPSAYTVYREGVAFDDPSVGAAVSRFSDAQRAHIAKVAEAAGLAFFDPTEALRAAAREAGPERLLYSPIHLHYTVAGNQALATILSPRIARLLKPAPPAPPTPREAAD